MVIDRSARGERHPGPAIAGILALWFTAVLGLGLTDILESGPSRPPLPVLAAVVIPRKLFALGYRASPVVPAFVLDIDLRLLTAMQAWRRHRHRLPRLGLAPDRAWILNIGETREW